MTYSKKTNLFKLSFEYGWCQNARHQLSSNYNQRPENCQINSIIIHGISLPRGVFTGNDIDDLFCNCLDCSKDASYQDLENLKVSAHFLIRRDGELVQYVSVFNRAWHAGASCLQGKEKCNDFSIGIELEGVDSIAYTEAQYLKLADLVATLRQDFSAISKQRIVGHSDIAPGRKTDPGEAFKWDKFFKQLEHVEQYENS